MVETSLFPRPHFASFLRADDHVDPLSYYEYQRMQRMQKVARLQERRAKSHEPGYKKPLVFSSSVAQPAGTARSTAREYAPHSRQIFSKPEPPPPAADQQVSIKPTSNEKPTSYNSLHSSSETKVKREGEERHSVPLVSFQKCGREGEEGGQVIRARRLKSATTRGTQQPASVSFSSRPNTVIGGTRAADDVGGTRTKDASTITRSVSFQSEKSDGDKASLKSEGTGTDEDEEEEVMDSMETERQSLAHTYRWTSSTHRAYNEVWGEGISRVPPPTSTIEAFPDPVSQRLTFRRYNSCPEGWQAYGMEWDYIQTRLLRQNAINFCAPTRYNQYLPGYTGCVPGNGEVDYPLLSRLLVRRLTPRPSKISRKANVPGYTGHTHWARIDAAHSDFPHPPPLTTASTHREIPLEKEISPYRRSGVLSKTISLVSPYNPFNKIEYAT